jgi:D-psicose/D-tagatose/L-ribulose 3-epimerase
MKLSASNLAWPVGQDRMALPMLHAEGFSGIEVAPSRIWPGWVGATPEAADRLRRDYADEGFAVPALQAVLFGVSQAQLFTTSVTRWAFGQHLRAIADLAQGFGAAVVVLGAPRSRLKGDLSFGEAVEDCAGFMTRLADHYTRRGVRLCIEPNPVSYGCDFVTNAEQGEALVTAVPGLGLHLDAAGMHLAPPDGPLSVKRLGTSLKHFHASEPDLGPFDTLQVDHAAFGEALRCSGYAGWVSLEMKEQIEPWGALSAALGMVRTHYGDRL